MAEEKSIFDSEDSTEMEDDGGIIKDENLPLEDILSNIKKEQNDRTTINEKNPPTQKEVKQDVQSDAPSIQEKEPIKGLVISNKELEEGEEQTKKRSFAENDARVGAFANSIKEYDEEIEKRKHVVVIKQPMNNEELAQMATEISSLEKDENGKYFFNLHVIPDKKDSPYITPKFVRLRTESDGLFDDSQLDQNEIALIAQKSGKSVEEVQSEISSDKSDEEGNTSEDKKEDVDAEKKKLVEIIVDKTGLGTNITFSDDEAKKIEDADTIRINEVENVDLNTLNVVTTDKSFQDMITESDTSGERVPILFPASGFKAQMKGLTYGEYTDLTLSMDGNIDFDKYYKRLTIIYNKMVNISTGPFKTIEDFLKHFAYTDIYLATYALFVATEPEIEEINLKCGNKDCGKNFNWKYSPRNVLRLERSGDTALKKMNELTRAAAIDYDKIRDNAIVNKSKRIKLPRSGFIVEMGMASAYEFLYNFVPLLNQDNVDAEFGDLADSYRENFILLTAIHSIFVPTGNGSYVQYTTYRDILDAIYNIAPDEIKILAAYTAKISNEYNIVFSLGDIKCPHCGTITHDMDIDIDDLVFQAYQRLMSTNIELESLQDF